MTDHACACAAASPARYRASSSSKAASMSLASNQIRAAIRPSDTTEDEAFAAGRNGARCDSKIGACLHVCDRDIATVFDPDVHHGTAIVEVIVVGQDLGHTFPIVGCKVGKGSLIGPACGVFKARRLRV